MGAAGMAVAVMEVAGMAAAQLASPCLNRALVVYSF
jgi:hypothetical protein